MFDYTALPGIAVLGNDGNGSGVEVTAVLADRWDLSTRVRSSTRSLLEVQPGRPVELAGPVGFGLTRLGYGMLAGPSREASVVVLDVRGWASPLAAEEAGVDLEQLVVVRCGDRSLWPRVIASVLEGVKTIYAEVPTGVNDHDLRRLAALARARQTRLVLRPVRGTLPSGIGHLRLRAREVHWEGTIRGHGRLEGRRLVLEATGKGAQGITRLIEVEDHGTDGVRVVSDLAAGQAGRAIG